MSGINSNYSFYNSGYYPDPDSQADASPQAPGGGGGQDFSGSFGWGDTQYQAWGVPLSSGVANDLNRYNTMALHCVDIANSRAPIPGGAMGPGGPMGPMGPTRGYRGGNRHDGPASAEPEEGRTVTDRLKGGAAGAAVGFAGAAAVTGVLCAVGVTNCWNPVGWGCLAAAAVGGLLGAFF
ncbi:MAG: hypothetical protein K2X66_04650 [Cyanobacteria bacterium]|nr:hypothetical protein [Cyanobacteriota bacterium]